MTSVVSDRPRDCFSCRVVGAAGLIGIGAYLANVGWKNKTFAGRVTLSTISLDIMMQFYLQTFSYVLSFVTAFVTLGVQRYKQEFPFEKRTEKS